MAGNDIGYYTLPVILSMEGVEKQVSSRLSKAFGDVGKKSGAALAQGSEAEVKKAIDSYGKLRDKAQDALGKIRVEEEKLNKVRAAGKTDQIIAAEERLAKARRDSNRLNREAIAGYEQIDAAQKRLADSMTGSGGLLGRLRGAASSTASAGGEAASGFIDGFGGPIAALGTKAGPIGIALAATAGLGLLAGKVLADNVLAGMDLLQGQADVAAKIGITAEQMKPLAAGAGAAYASNFGESIEANLDSVRAAVQGGLLDPDASAADVKKIVQQLSTVALVTGEDIPAAVRAAGQAMRTGLAKDATEAFDLIVRAQQAGLNVSGDLMDTLNEYSTQFRKLGIDGRDAMGLIFQAVKGGARDSDVAADALKEFSIRSIDGSKLTGKALQDLGLSWKATHNALAEGGPTARATFQQIIDAIAGVEDPAKRAQIQVALFGTQSEDLGDALNSMNLDTAAAEFDNVAGATQRAADTAGGTAASSWESAKRSVEVAVKGMQQSLGEVLGPALQKIADWVVAHKDEIGDFFIGMGHAAISAAEFVVRAAGDIAQGLGELIAPLGDVQGAMLKFQAWQADIRGDTETAAQLREEAEAAFSWGEGLTKAGRAMKDFDASSLHRSLDDAAAKAKGATTETSAFGTELGKLPVTGINVPVSVDTEEAKAGLDNLFEQYRTLSVGVELGDAAAAGALAGTALGAGIPLGGGGPIVGTGAAYGLPAGTNTGGYGGPGQDKFPQWVRDLAAAYGTQASTYAGHQEGRGVNQGIDFVGTPEQMEQLAAALIASKPAGLEQVIYQNPKTGQRFGLTPDGSLDNQPGGYYRDDWAGHQDHVHTRFSQSVAVGSGGVPGAGAAAAAAPDKPLAVTVTTPSGSPIPVPTVPDGTLPTVNLPAGNDSLINAYGPGYKPGIGTPGRDEYGELGYYRVDPDRVQGAIDSLDDRKWSAEEAERRAQAARDARTALNDDPNADASAIAGADRDVIAAERAAAVARREVAKSAQDLAEAQKGNFTKAREEQKKSKDKGKDDGLSGIGGIFGSFLKETLGIDISNLMPLQMLGTAFEVGGAMSKSLADHASTAPFGIPEIAAPPMPEGGAHGGLGGLPGPGTIVNVDNSQHLEGANLGWDPAQVEKQRNNNINRSPRLPVGVG